jgi:hypothetical protein
MVHPKSNHWLINVQEKEEETGERGMEKGERGREARIEEKTTTETRRRRGFLEIESNENPTILFSVSLRLGGSTILSILSIPC